MIGEAPQPSHSTFKWIVSTESLDSSKTFYSSSFISLSKMAGTAFSNSCWIRLLIALRGIFLAALPPHLPFLPFLPLHLGDPSSSPMSALMTSGSIISSCTIGTVLIYSMRGISWQILVTLVYFLKFFFFFDRLLSLLDLNFYFRDNWLYGLSFLLVW